MAVSDTARAVWLFLARWFDQHKQPPSYDEMAAGVGCSKSTISYNVRLLEAAGVIRRQEFRWRTVRLVRLPSGFEASGRLAEHSARAAASPGAAGEHLREDETFGLADRSVRAVVEKNIRWLRCPVCGGVVDGVSVDVCTCENGRLGSPCPVCGACVERGAWRAGGVG